MTRCGTGMGFPLSLLCTGDAEDSRQREYNWGEEACCSKPGAKAAVLVSPDYILRRACKVVERPPQQGRSSSEVCASTPPSTGVAKAALSGMKDMTLVFALLCAGR